MSTGDVLMVDIIIITWNARPLLVRCLESVVTTAHGITDSIIVIDNGSSDGTVEMVQQSFPHVRLVANSFNRGVAPARNQGLVRSLAPYALLLDADAELTAGALSDLIEFMEQNQNVGVAGPKLIGLNGEMQFSCRRFPTPAIPLMRRLVFLSWIQKAEDLQRHLMTDCDHSQPIPVDYVIGACQIIRRRAREEVGLLDAKIFYGPEDIDFCLRMWQKGWKVYYCPQAVVKHHEQRMTKRNPFSVVGLRHLMALFYFFKKYRFNLTKTLPERGAA